MSADQLLLWISARREGSWRQFRAAVEQLCGAEEVSEGNEFPLHKRLRLNLERLAHVEFFAHECEDGWRVAPPVLAGSSADGRHMGVLCGARSDNFLRRFKTAANDMGLESIQDSGTPTVLRVFGEQESDFVRIAAGAGARYQPDAPLAIILQLPIAAPPDYRQTEDEFRHGADWEIDEFQVEQLRWQAVRRAEASMRRTGLFRFTIHFQPPRYFLRWEGSTHEVRRAIGIYALLRRRRKQVLFYDRVGRTLALPATCRPMLLMERALVLCSGLIPTFDPRNVRLTYSHVPENIARLAAQILRQDLR